MIAIALNIVFLGFLIWYGHRSIGSGVIIRYYYPAVFLKLIAGWALGLIYLFYYPGGDTWNHFQNAGFLGDFSFQSYQNFSDVFIFSDYGQVEGFIYDNQPRSAFFCKTIALVNLLTGENYWLTSIYFSLFSFSGLWYLATRYLQLSGYKIWVSISLLFFPSLLFWSAGIMKESIAIGAMCFAIGLVLDFVILNRRSWYKLLIFGLLVYLIFLVKYYYAALLGAVVFALVIAEFIPNIGKKWKIQLAVWFLLVAGSILMFTWIHPNLSLSAIINVIVSNHDAYVGLSDTKHIINFNNLEPNWLSVTANVPKAWFFGLFAPLTMFSHSIFSALVTIENWLLLVLAVTSVLAFKLPDARTERLLLFAALTFISLLAVLLALSTPNLGTLARYKIGLMPVLLYLITVNQGRVIKRIRNML